MLTSPCSLIAKRRASQLQRIDERWVCGTLTSHAHAGGRRVATFIWDDSTAPLPRVNVGEIGRHGPQRSAPALLRPAPAGTFFTVNLLRRLNDYANAVRRFTQDPAVPFTNNLSE